MLPPGKSAQDHDDVLFGLLAVAVVTYHDILLELGLGACVHVYTSWARVHCCMLSFTDGHICTMDTLSCESWGLQGMGFPKEKEVVPYSRTQSPTEPAWCHPGLCPQTLAGLRKPQVLWSSQSLLGFWIGKDVLVIWMSSLNSNSES